LILRNTYNSTIWNKHSIWAIASNKLAEILSRKLQTQVIVWAHWLDCPPSRLIEGDCRWLWSYMLCSVVFKWFVVADWLRWRWRKMSLHWYRRNIPTGASTRRCRKVRRFRCYSVKFDWLALESAFRATINLIPQLGLCLLLVHGELVGTEVTEPKQNWSDRVWY